MAQSDASARVGVGLSIILIEARQVRSRGKGRVRVRWIVRVFKSEGNDRMEMCRTMLDSLLKCSVVQYSTVQRCAASETEYMGSCLQWLQECHYYYFCYCYNQSSKRSRER